jgi:hypothetical protein
LVLISTFTVTVTAVAVEQEPVSVASAVVRQAVLVADPALLFVVVAERAVDGLE